MIQSLRYILFWAYFGMVFLASLWPKGVMPEAVHFFSYPNADKVVHFLMYMIMSVMGAVTIFRPVRKDYPLIAFLFSCFCGLMLESLQGIIGSIKRTASLGDVTANIFGAFSGSMIILLWICVIRPGIKKKHNTKR